MHSTVQSTCVALLVALTVFAAHARAADTAVFLGVLVSRSGKTAPAERSILEAVELAADELNRSGGVLGRRLEVVAADPASDPAGFARMAEKLCARDQCATLFGCWSSESRKAVLPVLEKHDRLLWYPAHYEGQESSANVIYVGGAPNQQLIPALDWCLKRFGKRVLLVGTDSLYSRSASRILLAQLREEAASPLAEYYRPFGDRDFKAIAVEIRASKPDVVFSTVEGVGNAAFFTALHASGLGAGQVPVMSVALSEDELKTIDPVVTVGHYAAWNYFQSLDSPENARFVAAFKQRYGADRVTSDLTESAYSSVLAFAQAATAAGSFDTAAVRKAALGLTYSAPEGMVRIDPRNQHLWRVVRIGQIEGSGQFKIVWTSEEPVRPLPHSKLLEPVVTPPPGAVPAEGGVRATTAPAAIVPRPVHPPRKRNVPAASARRP